jgi:hypothetical protein
MAQSVSVALRARAMAPPSTAGTRQKACWLA